MNFISAEAFNNFVSDVHSHINKLNEKIIVISTQLDNLSKLEDKINNIEIKLEANKLVYNEKNDNLIYKLSVFEEKINNNNIKVNDLNNILMKHFAYKNTDNYKNKNNLSSINTQNLNNTLSPNNNPLINNTITNPTTNSITNPTNNNTTPSIFNNNTPPFIFNNNK